MHWPVRDTSAFRRRCLNTRNNYKIGFFRGFYYIIIIFRIIIISYKLHKYYNTCRCVGTRTRKKPQRQRSTTNCFCSIDNIILHNIIIFYRTHARRYPTPLAQTNYDTILNFSFTSDVVVVDTRRN